ncbi:LysR family transcriptional regulator [Vibrio navarrensis]|uniref:LysR family transcriptional regulator n=1 Tax=Vibrio navarrensis TaxID=29495 RepID=A0AAI9G7T7_9VIBR|nr:LysR family transcriptional regulator [Vibrio navarrensis]EJL6400111.1 LysR family transcriptional regulator [Vibrio navarrensis]EJL6565839.1 LysR family transcriptional regulator [Vibrio navarrensis]ELN6931281.1 LysR family transcriptional regulator [Vibrio navarrensis]
MDIEALRSFLAFVETGSFTRAAKQISRTQSAFSAQMRKLEEEIGASLFIKEGRYLVLSDAGVRLTTHARNLVTQHDESLSQLQHFQDKRPLRLGCPEDYNQTVLPTLVAKLQQLQPTCSIQIYSLPSVDLRRQLDAGELDCAILTRAPDSEEGYWLTSDQGVWIASPHYQADLHTPLTLALFQTDCKYHAAAIDGLTKRGIAFHLLACCNTASAQRALVEQGLAIGAMGRLSAGNKVQILADMPPLPKVDIVLAVAAKPHPLLSQQLLTKLESEFVC